MPCVSGVLKSLFLKKTRYFFIQMNSKLYYCSKNSLNVIYFTVRLGLGCV